ncbi:hypothetical protein GWC77_24130 [Paraburkholderia sp. NMBU_R16]|uniref:response regulator transcription factor n=1 Tax=Paraburkholderia sp. NMBU_R16 TaxID=2698676 RepID=UPI0015640886|nr:response regulator transcription factor [Paraburkholderia sp. NMBU_R16]NRO98999.1 hypothetical protein [Paraburkholderia sp. NMBU_R16]
MKIAVCTKSTRLFASIGAAFLNDGTSSCSRFDDQFSLMRYLSEVPGDIVLVDADRDFASVAMVFAWRCYSAKSCLPIVVIGEHLDCETMIEAFNAGADDIVVGASNIDELAVRVRRSYACRTAAAAVDVCQLSRHAGVYYYGVQLSPVDHELASGSVRDTSWHQAEQMAG